MVTDRKTNMKEYFRRILPRRVLLKLENLLLITNAMKWVTLLYALAGPGQLFCIGSRQRRGGVAENGQPAPPRSTLATKLGQSFVLPVLRSAAAVCVGARHEYERVHFRCFPAIMSLILRCGFKTVTRTETYF